MVRNGGFGVPFLGSPSGRTCCGSKRTQSQVQTACCRAREVWIRPRAENSADSNSDTDGSRGQRGERRSQLIDAYSDKARDLHHAEHPEQQGRGRAYRSVSARPIFLSMASPSLYTDSTTDISHPCEAPATACSRATLWLAPTQHTTGALGCCVVTGIQPGGQDADSTPHQQCVLSEYSGICGQNQAHQAKHYPVLTPEVLGVAASDMSDALDALDALEV